MIISSVGRKRYGYVVHTPSITQTTRGYRRVQGAALVAVRQAPLYIYATDGHKGRTLHPPKLRDDYFIRWS